MVTIFGALAMLSLFVLQLATIRAHKYEFVFENDKIFEKCSEIPGNNGIHDFMDMSEFIIEYNDGSIHIGGNMTLVWDIKPTDRVELHVELYKLQRGVWQPTVFSLHVHDFCKEQFKIGSMWHNAWSKYISKEDQICINNYQHVYHYESVNIDNYVSMNMNFQGIHKAKVTLNAFDGKRNKKSNSICFEFVGNLEKIRN